MLPENRILIRYSVIRHVRSQAFGHRAAYQSQAVLPIVHVFLRETEPPAEIAGLTMHDTWNLQSVSGSDWFDRERCADNTVFDDKDDKRENEVSEWLDIGNM